MTKPKGMFVGAIALCAVALIGAGVARAEPVLDAVDEAVAGYLGHATPGLAVAVLQDGKVVHLQGYGLADVARRLPVTVDSQFDLASVSKQMTALAAMMQMEEGLYAPDTPVGQILPAFEDDLAARKPLTVGHLVHHTGGLADYLDGQMDYQSDTPNAEVVDWVAEADRVRAPGRVFDYSNSGYVVLGSLVAAAEGAEDLGAVLRARVWGPLGMTGTEMVEPTGEVVRGYAGRKGKFLLAEDRTITQGDGGVYSTVADLARYETGLVQHHSLSAEATARLFENGTYDNGKPIDEDDTGYGWGWMTETYEGEDYASHSGSWTGIATYYQRNLTTGITVIILANGEDADVTEIGGEVELAAQDALAD